MVPFNSIPYASYDCRAVLQDEKIETILVTVNGRLLTYDDYFWTSAGPKSKATGNVGLVRVFPWPLM